MDISWAMNQDAIFKPLLSRDGYNRPVYTPEWDPLAPCPEVPVKVRWQKSGKKIKLSNGEDVKADGEVWAPLSINPKEGDVFIYKDKAHEVIKIDEPVSVYGEPSYYKFFCVSVPENRDGEQGA